VIFINKILWEQIKEQILSIIRYSLTTIGTIDNWNIKFINGISIGGGIMALMEFGQFLTKQI
jgi:hypothetical protein